MKKRIIALFALVAMLATMLTIPVSAELIVNTTFDGMTTKQDVIDAGWAPYNYNPNSTPPNPGMCGEVSFPDGAFRVAYGSSGRYFWNRSYTVPTQNHILMVDLKPEMDRAYISIQFYIGTKRVTYQPHYIPKANTWYTYMLIVSGNATLVKAYYKERTATDNVWTEVKFNYVGGDGVAVNGTKPANTDTSFKFGFDTSSRENQTGAILYDNFRVFTGNFLNSFDGFKLGTTKVEDVMEINAAGTLKADYEVYTDDISFTAGSAADKYNIQGPALKTIMVSFDKNLKMLDCDVKNVNLTAGANALSNQLTISDVAASDSYYGNIADGGYVGLYVWNGMQPFCEAKILN